MGRTWTVLRKELKDHVRDRRSVTSALLFPLLGPVLFAGMFSVLASWQREDKPLEVAVVGAQNAPSLMKFLERAGVETSTAPPSYEEKVREGELDVVLIIPDDYGADFEAGRPATVELVVDNSRNSARSSIHRAHRVLEAYGRQTAVLRLLARGISPELAMPVEVEEVDLATSAQMAARMLNMVPMFLLLAAFMGGMNLAIDSTAGERERGSLEPLLLNPVHRWSLVLGKWVATVLATWVSVLICLFGFKVALGQVPLEDLGIKAQFAPDQLVMMLLVVLPLSLLAASVQMLLAIFARSFKEAQSYVQWVVMVPLLPSVFLALSPIKHQAWMMALPFLSQDLLVTSVMGGEPLSATWVALSFVATTAAAIACLWGTVRLLAKERIVFGR